MRLSNQVISLFIALFISFVFVPKTSAQGEDESQNLLAKALESIDKDGRPSDKSWRGNLQDFSVSEGGVGVSLDSRNRLGRRLLLTSVPSANELTWSGHCELDKPLSSKNFAYILLCDLAQYDRREGKHRSLEYLALSIGGQGRRDVALVTIRLRTQGDNIKTAKIDLERDLTLLKSPDLPKWETLAFDYKVHYDYEQGKLSLNLAFDDKPHWDSHIGTIDWREILPQDMLHSFGFLIDFTKEHQRAFHFTKL